MTARASVVIPAHNHAEYLSAAIESCLAQTVPVEIVVVNDGSTDDTGSILRRYSDCIRAYTQANLGVAIARNVGMHAASGEFLMFLDADDTIEPTKIERQLAEFDEYPATGWVMCDVKIIDDISHTVELASKRYGYAQMGLVGYIGHYLRDRNFIPAHSPLIRKSAIGSVGFPQGKLEDWSFWRELSNIASVKYVDEVLCTYHKKRSGRNQEK